MDRASSWIGARITWRICAAGESAVTVDGHIDTAEHFENQFTRLSGALTSGGRFVLVTDAADLRPATMTRRITSGRAHFRAVRQGVRSSLG